MSNITKYLQLLIEITDFEIKYLKHINKIALFFYYLLLPTFMAIAALAGSEIKLVLFLACLILLDPALVYCYIKQQRLNSLVHGFTAMVLVEQIGRASCRERV